ncbi:MAG: ribonuclease III [Oscillospiraceae bacterium]|jgi:ribonuclease-3 family protein|nr:ribonuclease III [Oscillospiraceae bacterium]
MTPTQYSPLALAFLGDSVFDLLVRERLLCEANRPPARLHQAAKERVNARAQARAYEALLPQLAPEEAEILRRGKNAKPGHVPPGQTREDYAKATALETLFGWLWLSGRPDRARELFGMLEG